VVKDIEDKVLLYNKEVLRNPSIITLGDPSFVWK
jgi:hypothetical protein